MEKKHLYDRLFESPQVSRDRLNWLPRDTAYQRHLHAVDNFVVDAQNKVNRIALRFLKYAMPTVGALWLVYELAKFAR